MDTRIQRKPASRPKTTSQTPPAAAPRIRRGAYFNRELSWLSFNRRVLEQARNPKNPLLERVKFLAIVSSNLDEFFEIRVAGIIQQVESGMTEPTPDGLPPRETLRRIHAIVDRLVDDQYRCWHRELVPALAKNAIIIKTAHKLLPAELAWIQAYFHEQVLPVVTPLAIDQAHPFPQLGNKTLNVLVSLEDGTALGLAGADGASRSLGTDEAAASLGAAGDAISAPTPATRVAILPVPHILPRLVRLCPADAGPQRHIFLSEIIKLCAAAFFPGYRLRNACAFRVTRNSDLYIDDEESDNLLKEIEERLRNLRRNAAVRLEIEDHIDEPIFKRLCKHLKIAPEHVFRLRGPLNLLRLMSLTDIDRPDLKYPPFTPVNCSPLADAGTQDAGLLTPDTTADPRGSAQSKMLSSPPATRAPGLASPSASLQDIASGEAIFALPRSVENPKSKIPTVFDIIRAQDILLHHPYDSFAPVVDFVTQAARDPQVFAIKQTLYRTSGDSPIVRALIEASRNGKQVAALVELKARFDEANNIQWARQLEDAGVHVVYGLVGHKTHCKCSLIVRREGAALRRYAHLGTGNYNPTTARLYTDLSLFTAREHITADIASLFNTLTGFSLAPAFNHILVAPFGMHERIQELIRQETANAKAGRPARIIAKMNSLVDQATIDNLYAASRAGVKIDLIVRGICCLVPGIRGRSENIRVRSIVGRYLEHARVFYFENNATAATAGESDAGAAGEPLIYAGSADWMPRNFFRRVEVLFPVESPALRSWMTQDLLATELRDNENARELRSNGAYATVSRAAPLPAAPAAPPFSAQAAFMESAVKRAAGRPPLVPAAQEGTAVGMCA